MESTTYIVHETEKLQSSHESFRVQAKDLTEAKKMASFKKLFCGTILKIYSANNELLSYKMSNGRWKNI